MREFARLWSNKQEKNYKDPSKSLQRWVIKCEQKCFLETNPVQLQAMLVFTAACPGLLCSRRHEERPMKCTSEYEKAVKPWNYPGSVIQWSKTCFRGVFKEETDTTNSIKKKRWTKTCSAAKDSYNEKPAVLARSVCSYRASFVKKSSSLWVIDSSNPVTWRERKLERQLTSLLDYLQARNIPNDHHLIFLCILSDMKLLRSVASVFATLSKLCSFLKSSLTLLLSRPSKMTVR